MKCISKVIKRNWSLKAIISYQFYVYRLSNSHLIYIICISPQKRHIGYLCSKFDHEYFNFINNIYVFSLICYFCHMYKANRCVEYYGIWPSITLLNNHQWNTEAHIKFFWSYFYYKLPVCAFVVKSRTLCWQFQQRRCKTTNECYQSMRVCRS